VVAHDSIFGKEVISSMSIRARSAGVPLPANKDGGRNQSGDKTRLRIIEAAEALFADNGYEGTSLRGIMATAGVSISLISYHFGNKEGLLRAIFEHKAAPLNKQRHQLIQAAVAAHPVPKLDDLLRGYFLPSFRDSLQRKRRPDHFMRLVGRIGSDNSEIAREMMQEFFDEFQRNFIAALKLALPDLDEEDIYWRLHCLLCIITHTLNNPGRIYDLSSGRCDFRNVDHAFEHLLPFLVEGLRAPPPARYRVLNAKRPADRARTLPPRLAGKQRASSNRTRA
jgi:AcrR family transcriptional regulator